VGGRGGGGLAEAMVSSDILAVVETLAHGVVEVLTPETASKRGRGGVAGATEP